MVLFTPRLVRITLTNVSVSDEGGYFCQLYTDATHHQVATLSVLVPPETPTVEVKQEAVEGGEVELTCVSPRSKPATSLRWVRNSREIPGTLTWFIDRLIRQVWEIDEETNGRTKSRWNGMNEWHQRLNKKRVSRLVIDRLVLAMADGSVDSQQFKMWWMGDFFFPLLLSCFAHVQNEKF